MIRHGLRRGELADLLDLAVSVSFGCADIGDGVPDLREDEDSLTVVAKTHIHGAQGPRLQLEGALPAARAPEPKDQLLDAQMAAIARPVLDAARERDREGPLDGLPGRDPEAERGSAALPELELGQSGTAGADAGRELVEGHAVCPTPIPDRAAEQCCDGLGLAIAGEASRRPAPAEGS